MTETTTSAAVTPEDPQARGDEDQHRHHHEAQRLSRR